MPKKESASKKGIQARRRGSIRCLHSVRQLALFASGSTSKAGAPRPSEDRMPCSSPNRKNSSHRRALRYL
eukprot:542678-Amphidinium_carterae.1